MVSRARLFPHRAAPFLGRHPWVFSGAIDEVQGDPADGDEVEVVAADGRFVARGLFNSRSGIRVRLYSWQRDESLDRAFFQRRLREAVRLRQELGLLTGDGGCRLVFSEGDGLSGLVVDHYAGWLVVQLTSLALARRQEELLDLLGEILSPRGIYLRTEKGILEEEGLEVHDGPLLGGAPQAPVTIVENGLRYGVELRTGQKTGFFLDQRDNRMRAAAYAPGRRIADLFCYSGGFTLPLARAGAASLVAVDVSSAALELARENLEANGVAEGQVQLVSSDAFRWLEHAREDGERFDMIVLDPPRFARSSRGVAQALKGYRALNRLAVACLEPGGILVSCSCTGRVSRDAFLSVLASVEQHSGRRISILESRGQAPDHPVSPTCPETEYLKCLICRVE